MSAWREAFTGQTELGALLTTIEQLLALPATDVAGALNDASQILGDLLGADKIDALMYDLAGDALVAVGTSQTPMARKQREMGLDRQPLSLGGRAVDVFRSGEPYRTGRADRDPGELRGVAELLGVRSTVAAPIEVEGQRQGVLTAMSATPEFFSAQDLQLIRVIARWFGMVAQRARLVEQVARDADERGRRAGAEELVTVMAHDLRNYLTPVEVRLALLRRHAEHGDVAAVAKDAEQLGRTFAHLTRLVADLLDVGRIDQGIFSLRPERCDLVSLLREAVDAFQSAETPIVLRSPGELCVAADPIRVRQAIDNLLANAVRHSRGGEPVDVVLATEARHGRAWAVATITNEGPDIPAEMLPRLFERFAHESGSEGLGLGLFLARRIAQEHGGTLTLDASTDGKTGFRFALPADRVDAEPHPIAPD